MAAAARADDRRALERSCWSTALHPEAEGHGTDAAIAAYHEHDGYIRPRVPLIKLVASALTIGSGGSGGREGPIAQIGAGFGSLLGRPARVSAGGTANPAGGRDGRGRRRDLSRTAGRHALRGRDPVLLARVRAGGDPADGPRERGLVLHVRRAGVLARRYHDALAPSVRCSELAGVHERLGAAAVLDPGDLGGRAGDDLRAHVLCDPARV